MPKISAVRLKSETNCTVFIAKYIGRFVSDALSVLSVNGYPGAGVLSNTVRPHRSVAHAKVVVLYCTENNDGVVRAGYDRSQCGSRPHLTVRFGPDISNSVFEPYRTRENDIYNDWKSMHVRVHRFSLSPFSGAFGRWNRPQIRLGSLGLGNDWRELSPSGKQFNLSVNTTGYGQYVLVLFHVLFTPIQSPICRCVACTGLGRRRARSPATLTAFVPINSRVFTAGWQIVPHERAERAGSESTRRR